MTEQEKQIIEILHSSCSLDPVDAIQVARSIAKQIVEKFPQIKKKPVEFDYQKEFMDFPDKGEYCILK